MSSNYYFLPVNFKLILHYFALVLRATSLAELTRFQNSSNLTIDKKKPPVLSPTAQEPVKQADFAAY